MRFLLTVLCLTASSVVCGPVLNENEEHDRAMQNPDLFEGDILGIDQDDRNAQPISSRLWTGGVIPYRIEPELGNKVDLIRKAMEHIEEKTCIRFRPVRPTDRFSIKIFKGTGCYSFIGMLKKDQELSLGEGCYLHSIAVHEITHAIGFFHEHARSDRDDYIDIHWENINPKFVGQFRKLLPNQNVLFDRFDFNSIMLYSDTAFSRDFRSKTMTSKVPGTPIPNVYAKPGLSRSDEYRIKRLYKCK